MVRLRWLPWCVCAALFFVASIAQGTVTLETRPGGFNVATEAAAGRAAAWAAAGGGSVKQVYSTDDGDDFAEILAVIEMREPFPDDAAADPGAAMLASAGRVLGRTEAPVDAGVNFDEDGKVTSLSGTWWDEDAGETYFVAMASGGATHGVIVLAVRSNEALMYERTFDDVVAGIAGTAPPIARFNVTKWRIAGFAGWTIFALLAWALVWRRGEGTANATETSRRVAAVCTIAAFVVLIAAWIALGPMDPELSLAGLSREWAAAEVFLLGVFATCVALLVGAIRSAQVKPIQSAPDGGAFGRLRNQAVRAVPPHADVVPARVDGPSTLAAADEHARRPEPEMEAKVLSIVGGQVEFPPPTQPGGPPER